MTDQPIRCENVACPDPGIHAHTIDSRDDLDAARWNGYWPVPGTHPATCGRTAEHGPHAFMGPRGARPCVGNRGPILGAIPAR